MRSDSLKVVVPQIDIDGVPWRGLLAPQLARREAYSVNVLRLLTLEMSVGVREDKNPVVAVDGAEFAPRVARQARMADWIDVAGAHLLSRLKAAGTLTSRLAGLPLAISCGTLSAVSGGIALGEPGAGFPLSISARVARPLLTKSSVVAAICLS